MLSTPLGGVNSFSHLCDSLYILTILNQFELDYDNYVPNVHAFLCYALFCYEAGAGNDDSGDESSSHNVSVLSASAGVGGSPPITAASAATSTEAVAVASLAPDDALVTAVPQLQHQRAVLAQHLRAMRKHGVVPALLSLFGFAAALAISIPQAYRQLRAKFSEYTLSLGLMMTWLPVLVAFMLLDYYPMNTDLTCLVVQRFFNGALNAWQAKQQRQLSRPVAPQSVVLVPNRTLSVLQDETEGILLVVPELLSQQQQSPLLLSPSLPLLTDATQCQLLVLAFGSQVRRKWHCGVAYDIIVKTEHQVDNWLKRSNGQLDYIHLFERGNFARVDGNSACDAGHHPASFFHTEQVWQLLAALFIVAPATFGAFTVSYNTLPVGIGCCTAGFLLFSILAFGSYMIDVLGSWLHHCAPGSPHGAPHIIAPTTVKAAVRVVCVALTVLAVLTSSLLVMHLLGQTFLWY